MNRTTRRFASGLMVAGLLVSAGTAHAAIVNNGDPIGTDYKIFGISVAGSVDFTPHTPVSGTVEGTNNFTIGKLTLTLNHGALVWEGFDLVQNGIPGEGANFGASAGLRVLLDVVDENGMEVPWIDYHIRAVDNTVGGPAHDPDASHSPQAHFHDTTFGFGSSPLVVQGNADNVLQINYGLGTAVNPGGTFTASNILVHERNWAGLQRQFRIETIPSVPEPTTFLLAAVALFGWIAVIARRRQAGR